MASAVGGLASVLVRVVAAGVGPARPQAARNKDRTIAVVMPFIATLFYHKDRQDTKKLQV
jgi:hypothetical protein